jgi:hypothetical protein
MIDDTYRAEPSGESLHRRQILTLLRPATCFREASNATVNGIVIPLFSERRKHELQERLDFYRQARGLSHSHRRRTATLPLPPSSWLSQVPAMGWERHEENRP